MMMKRVAIAVASLGLMTAVSTAFADNTPAPATPAVAPQATAAVPNAEANLKIGVVDMRMVIDNSPQMKAAANNLRSEFKPRQDKIIAAQQALQKDQDKLKRDGAVMSQSDATALQAQITTEGRDLQRMQEDYMQDLRTAQQTAMQSFLTSVDAIVQKITTQNGYDLILRRDTVAYASPRTDITQQVIASLNSKKA
jgi:outer membrane protein